MLLSIELFDKAVMFLVFMANQGNSWRKMVLKSRVPAPTFSSKKTASNLIKQSEAQAKKRLESKE